jgi:hypothetical protein
MANTKYFKNRVILKFALIIKEYFDLMNQNETLKNTNNPNNSLFIGMNAIHRVFEYILIKNKNIDHAYYYSQKCYFYYLEYMEQIHKSDLLQNLNHIDAILFVYKKTIFDIYDGEHNNSSTTISNIMTLNDEDLTLDEKDLRELLKKISTFTKTLFFWNNNNITFENRVKICDTFLHRYLHRIDSLDLTNSYLDMIQQKITMNYSKYEDLLNEIIHKIERTKRVITLNEDDKNEYFLMKFYVENDIFQEKFHEESTKNLVNWLFV